VGVGWVWVWGGGGWGGWGGGGFVVGGLVVEWGLGDAAYLEWVNVEVHFEQRAPDQHCWIICTRSSLGAGCAA